MATPSSYPLTSANIQSEFGSSINTSGECLGIAAGVPSSYPLSSGDLLGISSVITESFTVTEGDLTGATTKYGTTRYFGWATSSSTIGSIPGGGINDSTYRGVALRGIWRKSGANGSVTMRIELAGDRTSGWITSVNFQGYSGYQVPDTVGHDSTNNLTYFVWSNITTISGWEGTGTRTVDIRYGG